MYGVLELAKDPQHTHSKEANGVFEDRMRIESRPDKVFEVLPVPW